MYEAGGFEAKEADEICSPSKLNAPRDRRLNVDGVFVK